MNTVRERGVVAGLAIFGLTTTYAVVYRWAMATFERHHISLSEAFQVVIESVTTAGFGGHAPWTTPELHALVILMNLTGVAVIFVGVPYVIIPFLRTLADTPPKTTDTTDHVVIAAYNPHDEILREELDAEDIPYVVVEPDVDTANRLDDENIPVVNHDAETVAGLHAANIPDATAVVADMDDDRIPTALLSARQANPDARRLSVANKQAAATYHRLAGADDVVCGKDELGKSLGLHATTSFAEEFVDALDVDFDGDITEVIVKDGSPLCGQTIRDAASTHFDDNVIVGGWFNRKFILSPEPDMTIPRNSVLWLVGNIEPTDIETRVVDATPRGDTVVVCGYGSVGSAVADHVDETGFDTILVDEDDTENVDIVGDITDPQTFSHINFSDVRAVVLAVNDDSDAIYTSLVLSDMGLDTDIIARANSAESVWKLYHAGATRALSLADVTGESLASLLIENEKFFTPNRDFNFVRTTAPALVGQTLGSADVRARTGCKVVAIERGDGTLLTSVSAETTILDEDTLIAAGTPDAIDTFQPYATDGTLPENPPH